MPTREVVLPASVANARLTVLPRSTGRVPDLARVQFYVDDQAIRSLRKVRTTDGGTVDLSTFDGHEVPGARVPDFYDEVNGRYLSRPTWGDHDMYRGPFSNDPFNSDYYFRSEYKGRTRDGWDHHAYQMPMRDVSPGEIRREGVAPYIVMKLADGTEVRGWLTPQGNEYP